MPSNSANLNQFPSKKVARVGLISDTHMPERCAAFPAAIFEVFQGVDLILHAGDVGKLWVLDQLSGIGPVVAVHGNDETAEAQQALPSQQLVSIGGRRILVWHSHYPDPAEDKANRRNLWGQILARIAQRSQQVGADIVVFGHTHVPTTYRYKDVWLVNPGALASGSIFTRQTMQTVAVLFIYEDSTISVTHVDLNLPNEAHVPNIDFKSSFKSAPNDYEDLIVEQSLIDVVGELKKQSYNDIEALRDALLPLSHLCWAGEKEYITKAEMLEVVEGDANIAPMDKEKVMAILSASMRAS